MRSLLILLLSNPVQSMVGVFDHHYKTMPSHYTFKHDYIPLITHLPEMTSLILENKLYSDLNRLELMVAMDNLHSYLMVQPHFVYWDGVNLKARPVLMDHQVIKTISEWTGPPHRLKLPQAIFIYPSEPFTRLPKKTQERIADFAEKLKTHTVEQVLRMFDNPEAP